jgi:hypothetical protein
MTLTAGLRRSFPTLGLVVAPFRWIGRSRRRIWVAALLLLAMIAGPPLWWAMQLIGLPDIGDPFDVETFRAFTITEDRNAFALYRQAAAQLKPWERFRKPSDKNVDMLAPWSKADPEVRRWTEENREALALYRQGSERPDALDRAPAFQPGQSEDWEVWPHLYSLQVMARLEGSRLEEQDDMAGAWGWYRAILRCLRHIGMHGTVYRRRNAQRWYNQLRIRLMAWAADPRTTPSMLRQALDDVVASESLSPSESYTLKAEYLDVDRLLDEPGGPVSQRAPSWLLSLGSPDYRLTPEQARSLYDAWRIWRREPERSRRVIRLATANWLAYHDLPPGDRPSPDPNASLVFDFYPFGPGAPANARVLSPQALGRWLDSTIDASFLLGYWGWNRLRLQERRDHRALLILLGTQLYRRERGTDPPTPKALVGPYLKGLLSDDLDDERDETIPRAGDTIE